MQEGFVNVAGGGGYPPGGGGPGGGWGPPPGAPPGGGGYGPPGGAPPGAPPGGYGPPGGSPPGGPPSGGWGPPPGAPPPGGPPGYGPPGGPPPGGQPPHAPYQPPGAPPGGGLPPGYVPPGVPPGGAPGYGPPGGAPPGGGYGPPGGAPGYGPPGGAPGYGPPGGPPQGGGYGPPGGAPPGGGYGPPGGGPPGWGGPPGGFVPPPGGGVSPTAPGVPGAWSPTEAVSFGWNAVMKNFAGVALPIAVAVFVLALPGAVINVGYNLGAALIAEYVDPSFVGMLAGLVSLTSSVVNLFVGSYMAGGIVSFALKVARGQPVQFGDVFAGGPYFGRMLVAGLCAGIAVGLGMCLLLVPGIIVALGISQYQYLVVDQGMGGIDALKKSWEMTQGHKMNIFVFVLLAIVVVIAGYIACLVGALLVSTPVLAIAGAYIYLSIKGETPRLAQ